jgi:hypothetical protein
LILALFFLTATAFAKDAPLQVIDWPATGTPVLRFTFSKLKQFGGVGTLRSYSLDTTAQNLSSRLIPGARFTIYLFDKNKVRIGEEVIAVENVGPGETVKFQTNVSASGSPVSISIQDVAQNGKTVSMTVNSTPQGATLRVDGAEGGTTPRTINVGVGKHILTFSKEGFTTGNFPLDISSADVSGGSINYELGAAAFDSIEMRDGSVLSGDLVSISGMDVELRIGGSIQHVDRNQIKRVMLVHRDAPVPNLPPTSPPSQ